MKIFIALACLLVSVYARSVQRPEVGQWKLFKAQHGKTYDDDAEEQLRMKIFLDNKDFVEAHNQRHANGESGFTVALNKFADLTNQEFNAIYNNFKSNTTTRPIEGQEQKHSISIADVPTSIDWRNLGVVTPVKNQGRCGSCWAFSTTGSIEGQHAIFTGNLVSLSEQQLVDCSNANKGCSGGNVRLAFDYIIQYHGLDTENSYNYTGIASESCKATKSNIGATIRGFIIVPSGDEEFLTSSIGTAGPVSIAIDASQPTFQFYQNGVYDDPNCSSVLLNHAVLAVGYDSTLDGKDYYIVKNSWSQYWGDKGYIFMSRNSNNQCGIATDASYPIV